MPQANCCHDFEIVSLHKVLRILRHAKVCKRYIITPAPSMESTFLHLFPTLQELCFRTGVIKFDFITKSIICQQFSCHLNEGQLNSWFHLRNNYEIVSIDFRNHEKPFSCRKYCTNKVVEIIRRPVDQYIKWFPHLREPPLSRRQN